MASLQFVPGVTHPDVQTPSDIIILKGPAGFIAFADSRPAMTTREDVSSLCALAGPMHFLGYRGKTACYTATLDCPPENLPATLTFESLRVLTPIIGEELFFLCGRASQVLDWDQHHVFCGTCGTRTEAVAAERARKCPACGLMVYPRISPAMIVAVVKNGKLLLAHNRNFPEGLYSVLAGFVEPGETFEECVRREVREEVGIEIKNITYYTSQPWPFPNALMTAFLAEWESGDIAVDGIELSDAGWYGPTELPTVPPPTLVGGKLVKWFCETHGA